MENNLIIIAIIYSLACGGFTANIANEKGRDVAIWFVLGLLFNIAALIAIVGLKFKDLEGDEEKDSSNSSVHLHHH